MSVQKRVEKRKKEKKRTQYMCSLMLKWIRVKMCFDPRDMRACLANMPRRTYQDYEAGKRNIPKHVAEMIRDIYRRDCEFMAGLDARVDSAVIQQFPNGFIPSENPDYFEHV